MVDYEKRFKRFTEDLLALIEKHMLEWDEAEKGNFDIDAIMAKVNSDEPTETVYYNKSTKKIAGKKKP